MINNNIEMRILIKGKPISEYAHNGQLFVEGRHGSNYEIELVNRNAFQVEAILSVDGLSVIDGKDAGPHSSGYLLKAGETLRIPGWKLDSQSVAAFQFGGKGGSYAAQSTGSARNTGVIGIIAYREKPQAYAYPTWSAISQTAQAQALASQLSSLSLGSSVGYNNLDLQPFSIANYYSGNSACNVTATASSTLNCANTADFSLNAQGNVFAKGPSGAEGAQGLAGAQGPIGARGPVGVPGKVSRGIAPAVEQNLGTAFGKEQDFATTSVSFLRGDMLAMSVVYYDDRRGLTARGIVIERRPSRRDTPDAFPGMGCRPPAGWRG